MKKIFACLFMFVFVMGFCSIAYAGIGDKVKTCETQGLFDQSVKVDVANLKGRTVFVFVSALCTQCRQEISDIKANMDKIKSTLYIVSVDMNVDVAKKVYEKHSAQVTFLHDPEYKLGQMLGVNGTPTTVIIENGAIADAKNGYSKGDWNKF